MAELVPSSGLKLCFTVKGQAIGGGGGGGGVAQCTQTHRPYSAASLGDKATSTTIHYPTQSHYSDIRPKVSAGPFL